MYNCLLLFFFFLIYWSSSFQYSGTYKNAENYISNSQAETNSLKLVRNITCAHI